VRFTVYGSMVDSNLGGAPQVAHEVGARGQFVEQCIGATVTNPGDGSLACIP